MGPIFEIAFNPECERPIMFKIDCGGGQRAYATFTLTDIVAIADHLQLILVTEQLEGS